MNAVRFVWVHEPCFGEGPAPTSVQQSGATSESTKTSWTAFPQCDQNRLNAAIISGKDEAFVYGYRWVVHVRNGTMSPRFWKANTRRVMRVLWHKEGLPYTEEESLMIDSWARSPIDIGKPLVVLVIDGKRRIEVNTETQEIVEVIIGWFTSPKIPITRGWPSIPVHGDSAVPVSDLVICIHGIGEHLWSQQAFAQPGLVEQCRGLRVMVNDTKKEASTKRIEFLPVEWHSVIHSNDDAVKRQLEAITLPSVPMLRTMTNDCISDVLFYQGSQYQNKIRETVVRNINKTVQSYLSSLDASSPVPKISFICHSLGSVIIYDILHRQKDTNIPATERLDFGPTLVVTIPCLFLIGSPVALFLTCRGSCADIIPEHVCHRLYNVFNPTDPVAYRIEPLLSLRMRSAPPEHVPAFSEGGGVRAHVQLKGVMKALADSAYEVATKDGGIKNAFIGPMKSFLGLDADEMDSLHTAIESVMAINGGERIDWVLQEGLIESANDYVTAVVSHNRYFNNEDFAAFTCLDHYRSVLVGGPAGAAASVSGIPVFNGFVDKLAKYGDSKASYDTVESEEGGDPYKELARRDQILDFFERDYDDVMGYLPEALEGIAPKGVLDRGRAGIEEYMEDLRVAYYNAVNGEAFQNQQLEVLVPLLIEKRENLKKLLVTGMSRNTKVYKDMKISLEHTKLDIQDRLDKRNIKHQERMELVPKLTKIIGRAKLAKFLATTDNGANSNCVEVMSPSSKTSEEEPALRQRRKIYSNKELTALLQRDDDA
ncbi:hypothetical protein FOL47_008005 [Perkinsus chesapeaki]|uniref:DDHD domain-containing protein n=1 Tax=Perkinsus chesapeaki TaxID=330153 RepID=A0A7J6LH76_PERCH|nr:hypothetical protein FOL47_008005 [Perkinsus chesapeaki]